MSKNVNNLLFKLSDYVKLAETALTELYARSIIKNSCPTKVLNISKFINKYSQVSDKDSISSQVNGIIIKLNDLKSILVKLPHNNLPFVIDRISQLSQKLIEFKKYQEDSNGKEIFNTNAIEDELKFIKNEILKKTTANLPEGLLKNNCENKIKEIIDQINFTLSIIDNISLMNNNVITPAHTPAPAPAPAHKKQNRTIKPFDYKKESDFIAGVKLATDWMKSLQGSYLDLNNQINANLDNNASSDVLHKLLTKAASMTEDSETKSNIQAALKYLYDKYGPGNNPSAIYSKPIIKQKTLPELPKPTLEQLPASTENTEQLAPVKEKSYREQLEESRNNYAKKPGYDQTPRVSKTNHREWDRGSEWDWNK